MFDLWCCGVQCFHTTELEAKLDTNQIVQEELKKKVDQTAAAVEEVKTTITEGKRVYTPTWSYGDGRP